MATESGESCRQWTQTLVFFKIPGQFVFSMTTCDEHTPEEGEDFTIGGALHPYVYELRPYDRTDEEVCECDVPTDRFPRGRY